MNNEIYVTPLAGRYPSKEMNKIWSSDSKYSTWRKLWVALAETEKELGIDITDEQINEMKENVNNINIPHLHFGMQLIFNEVQKEGYNQIWIDVYEIIEFLRKNTSSVYMAYDDTKDFERRFEIMPVE